MQPIVESFSKGEKPIIQWHAGCAAVEEVYLHSGRGSWDPTFFTKGVNQRLGLHFLMNST